VVVFKKIIAPAADFSEIHRASGSFLKHHRVSGQLFKYTASQFNFFFTATAADF
jgi:hypothetical protein